MSTVPPMRILQVNSLFNGGGADNQTMELAAGLRDLGHSVVLSVPSGSRWEPRGRQLGLPLETFPAKTFLQQAMIRRWAGLISVHRMEIIHAHQGRDFWPAIIAARAAGCGTRVVITRHLMTRPRRLSRWLLLRQADVVAVSKAVEGVLQLHLRGPRARLHQIYCGIDLTRFDPKRTKGARELRQENGWTEDAVVFGVVGAFDLPRGKGQLEFLEAAARLKTKFPQARFAMIGRGTMESLLRERLVALGLKGMATLVPFTEKIPDLMNALDVLVHPAVGTEALPVVLWEGMACAKPVVASRLDGIPEAFVEREHGFLVPPGDVAALAEAMRAFLEDSAQRVRFGTAACEHVHRHFSRARQAEQMSALYARLLAGRLPQ